MSFLLSLYVTTFAVSCIELFFVMKIEKTTKLTIQVILSVILVLSGIVLLFMGFEVAPQGQIHDSVLIGSGETFTFAGALLGIEYAVKTAVLKTKQELKDESGQ